jgi:hypothetical protein
LPLLAADGEAGLERLPDDAEGIVVGFAEDGDRAALRADVANLAAPGNALRPTIALA